MALELASAGCRVILTSRRVERLQIVAERLRAAGHQAEILAGDLQSENLLKDLEALAPTVDILINNAAVFAPYGNLEEVAQDDIDAVLAVDLRAAMRLSRHVLPGMKAQGFGRIINMGSVAGRLGAAGQVAYSSAKSGLEGLTRSVAIESARSGVTCNLVEPGLVETERVIDMIDEDTRSQLISATPIGRAGRPEEVAHVVAYLASDAAACITGATIPVDGGISIR